jgi:hypothetical protein
MHNIYIIKMNMVSSDYTHSDVSKEYTLDMVEVNRSIRVHNCKALMVAAPGGSSFEARCVGARQAAPWHSRPDARTMSAWAIRSGRQSP